MAITEPPGSVMEGLGNGLRERRLGPGSIHWWNRFRRRAVEESLEEETMLEFRSGILREGGDRAKNSSEFEPSSPVRIEMSESSNHYKSSPLLSTSRPSSRQDFRNDNTGISSGQDSNSNETGRRTPHPYRSSDDTSTSNLPGSRRGSITTNHQESNLSRSNSTSNNTNSTLKKPKAISFNPINLDPNSSISLDSPFNPRFPFNASTFSLNQKLDEISTSDDHFPLAKMCLKCPNVPLFKALAHLPPELRAIERDTRTKGKGKSMEKGGGISKKSKKKRRTRRKGASEADLERRTSLHIQNIEETVLSHQEDQIGTRSRDRNGNEEEQDYLSDQEEDQDEGESEVRNWLGEMEAEKLVPRPKPERTHHCSVCKTCVLKFVSCS